MADGLIVMVGFRTGPYPCGQNDMTCDQSGAGLEEQKLPVWTIAWMPYCARSFCRVPGSTSTSGLMVSVSVPLALRVRVEAAVRIGVPACTGLWPANVPAKPRARAVLP